MNDEHFDSEIAQARERQSATPYPHKSQQPSPEAPVSELSVALLVITVSISCR